MAPGGSAAVAAPPGMAVEAAVRAAVGPGRLLAPGDRVLVAVSGGPDSVALLHALVTLAPACALEVRAGHVHHGLRPEADRDAAFVEALAARLGCPVAVRRVTVPAGGGRSPEDAARRARHAALRELAAAVGARWIALAHTADDQVETVLMRVLQGAGPRGLAGIPVRRGPFVRPLLGVTRAEVLAHLQAHRLEAIEDRSNRDPRFLRNRLRHEVLPALRALGGFDVDRALRRLGQACRESVEALDWLLAPRAALVGRPAPGAWLLDLAPLEGLPPGAVKALLWRGLLAGLGWDGPGGGLRAAHLEALAELLRAPVGAMVRLAGGVRVERGRDGLWVLRRPAIWPPVPVAAPGATRAPDLDLQARVEPLAPGVPLQADGREAAAFDVGALPGPLGLRPAGAGDRMLPWGGVGRVRVVELLAGAGVPPGARRGWPLLVAAGPGGEEVLWVVGVRRGQAAPVGPATRRVLRFEARWPGRGPGEEAS